MSAGGDVTINGGVVTAKRDGDNWVVAARASEVDFKATVVR